MSGEELWERVDAYISSQLVMPDAVLEAALRASEAAGLPAIHVPPNQGKFLMLLARMQGARRMLEIGTLGGYSTLWLARALPADGSGCIVTLEYDPRHAEVARGNFRCGGVEGIIDLRVGPALETLPELAAGDVEPFDFIFIDANKEDYADYLSWSLRLARPGGVIVADNVVRKGAVADPAAEDARVQGVQRFYERLAAEKGVTATAVQTVGSKGHDGFALILVDEKRIQGPRETKTL